MKGSQKPGRLELLAWLNGIVEADYPRVEQLSDGIGYAQLLDSLYPGIVPLIKMNCNLQSVYTKSEEDCVRNLRIVEAALQRLKAQRKIDSVKLARGKFADNMDFLQWLYGFYEENKGETQEKYAAVQRRTEAISKQRGGQLAPHLVPNHPTEQEPGSDLQSQRVYQLRDLVSSLEQELTNQVSNYRILQEDIQQVEEERNFYFQKLRRVEDMCSEYPDSPCVAHVMETLSATPEEFLPAK
jgi:RP/EB family microtubule-associated protein